MAKKMVKTKTFKILHLSRHDCLGEKIQSCIVNNVTFGGKLASISIVYTNLLPRYINKYTVAIFKLKPKIK